MPWSDSSFGDVESFLDYVKTDKGSARAKCLLTSIKNKRATVAPKGLDWQGYRKWYNDKINISAKDCSKQYKEYKTLHS